MLWLLVIIGAGLVLIAALYLLRTTVPPRKYLLIAALKEHRIEPTVLSDECLIELAKLVPDYQESLMTHSDEAAARTAVRNGIKGIAINIACICYGDKGFTPAEIKAGEDKGYPSNNIVWEVLAKHDPKRFGLDQLEKTQTINSRLYSMTIEPSK